MRTQAKYASLGFKKQSTFILNYQQITQQPHYTCIFLGANDNLSGHLLQKQQVIF